MLNRVFFKSLPLLITSLLMAVGLLIATPALAAANIFTLVPSLSTATVQTGGMSSIAYTVTNTSGTTLNNITYDSAFSNSAAVVSTNASLTTCTSTLAAGADCNLEIKIQAPDQPGTITLKPRVCAEKGVACSVPSQANRTVMTVMTAVNLNKGYVSNLGVAAKAARNHLVTGPSVAVFNQTTDTVTKAITPAGGLGNSPFFMAFTPDLSKLYVTNAFGSKVISIIDIATDTVVDTLTVPATGQIGGLAFSPDGSKLYIADPTANAVIVMNPNTKAVLKVITAGIGVGPVQPLLCSVSGKSIYVANENSDNISVIDIATDTAKLIALPAEPGVMTQTTDGTKLYFGFTNSPAIGVIDLANNDAVSTIPISYNPVGVAVTPDGSTLYVTAEAKNVRKGAAPKLNGNDVVLVINAQTKQIEKTITPPASTGIGLIVSNATGSKVYFNNVISGSTSVIDTATNTITKTFSIGTTPAFILLG